MVVKAISLEQNILIQAPRARIWQALTDLDQLIKWLNPALVMMGAQMQRDENGTISVLMGPMGVDFVSVEGVKELQRLTMRSLPDRLITTTFVLEENDEATSVNVMVKGFEHLLEDVQQDRRQLSQSAWENTLANLKAFVTGQELPFPFAAVSPLFGYWREAKNTLSSERSIWIDAPRERVWQAITDPKEMQQWQSPETPWVLTSLEVGGRFYVQNEENHGEMYVEVIELLEPPHQLATRTVPEPPDTMVKGKAYDLAEENGGTRLTVTLSGYELEPEETRWSNMEQNTFGFGMMLQNTKAYIEGNDLPFPGGF